MYCPNECTVYLVRLFSRVASHEPISQGVRIEAVGSIRPDTIQHVVPSAHPTNDVFTQTLDLEEGELYAFTIVDTSNNGIQTVESPSKLRSYRRRGDKNNFVGEVLTLIT